MCVQLKLVSGQALALNSLGINKFLSGDLQLANDMFQVLAPECAGTGTARQLDQTQQLQLKTQR
jgi:hypothetical protein